MKTERSVVIFFVAALIANVAFAGGTVRTPGGGATGTAEGGGEAILPMDVWNKLQTDEKQDLHLGTEIIVPKFTFRNVFGHEQKSKNLVHVLPDVDYTLKLKDNLAGFINVYADHAQGAAFEKNSEQWGFDTQSLIARINTSVGLSLKLSEMWTVAIGLDVGVEQMKLDYAFDLGRVPLPLLAKSKAYGLGFGFSGAVICQATDRLRLGAQISSPMTIVCKGRTELLRGRIYDSWKADMDFPLQLQLAGSYQLTDRLGLAGDVNWYGFSKNSNDLVLDFSRWNIKKPLHLGWTDTWSTHGGFNYKLTSKLTARCGVGYLSKAVNNVDTITLDVAGWDWAAGISYKHSDRISVNAAVTRGLGASRHNGKEFTADLCTFALDCGVRF